MIGVPIVFSYPSPFPPTIGPIPQRLLNLPTLNLILALKTSYSIHPKSIPKKLRGGKIPTEASELGIFSTL